MDDHQNSDSEPCSLSDICMDDDDDNAHSDYEDDGNDNGGDGPLLSLTSFSSQETECKFCMPNFNCSDCACVIHMS